MTGNLDGSGQFGFLGVELKNATLAVSSIGVSLTLAAASGNKIRVDDLLSADSLGPLASINVTSGSGHDVVLNAEVSASAVLPGSDQPFDIGTASFSATWADITQPTNVNVSVSGAIGDFLKAKADQIVSVLVEIRDVAQASNTWFFSRRWWFFVTVGLAEINAVRLELTMFRRVAGCSMRQFMAGAASRTIGGKKHGARQVVGEAVRHFGEKVRRGGGGGSRSARGKAGYGRSPVSFLRSNNSVNAGSSDRTAAESGVTKCWAPGVRIQRTFAPRSFARRMKSRDL